VIVLLLKDDRERGRLPGVTEKDGAGSGRPRIRCPRCAWEPRREDLWMCVCLFVWNTFETGGVCPSCGHRWAETQCQRCHEWSAHLDWYVDDADRAS
jgi:hypothetical protein